MMYRYLLMAFIVITLNSCIRFYGGDDIPSSEIFENYEPVILSREAFEHEVGVISTQPLENPGKIYVYGDFLFINEKNMGFHVYDNTYPDGPQKVKFIKAVGATDISIKGQNYYINQATDLIAFHYNENQNTFELTKRIKNVFPQKLSPEGFSANAVGDSIVTNWIKKTYN